MRRARAGLGRFEIEVRPYRNVIRGLLPAAHIAVDPDAGEITLNYVAPEARLRGVSRALLGALEARAAERGNTSCTLTSTETAHRFYRSSGYRDDGKPAGNFGTSSGYPMSKRLPDGDS